MYELYQSYCEEKDIAPAKLHVHRDIFNHELNIEFQKPKKIFVVDARNLITPKIHQMSWLPNTTDTLLLSQINRALSPAEIFSPLGLLRILPNVNRKNQFIVIQMQSNRIKNYSQVVSLLDYKSVPYFPPKQWFIEKTTPTMSFIKKNLPTLLNRLS